MGNGITGRGSITDKFGGKSKRRRPCERRKRKWDAWSEDKWGYIQEGLIKHREFGQRSHKMFSSEKGFLGIG